MSGETNGGVFNPQNLGLYSYVVNNPIKHIDPDGKKFLGFTYRFLSKVPGVKKHILRPMNKVGNYLNNIPTRVSNFVKNSSDKIASVFSKTSNYTIDSNKYNFFFGKVTTGKPHNIARSAQNLKDLTTLGIKNPKQLNKIFDNALKSGKTITSKVNEFGMTISKRVNIGSKGAIDVGFFYEKGSKIPKVTTIIPKIFK